MREHKSKLRIGISSCLLGQKVRYDGNHQLCREIRDNLADSFEFFSFCPEVDIGLGVPREKIQLVALNNQIVCLDEATHTIDYTQQLVESCDRQLQQLALLSGYIFKTKSPSCGLTKVKTDYQGEIIPTGQGIFANRLLQHFPQMPVIEEDQFLDNQQRQMFIDAVFCYAKQQK